LVANTTSHPKPGTPSGLVLVPTRELAEQVHKVLISLYGAGERRVVAVYGGTAYGPQRNALRRGVDVVVACPGRLEDLVARGDVRLDQVKLVVLDEADRMVDMGFLNPVRRLVDQTRKDRQVLLFSATMSREVETISRQYQHDPRRCVIETDAGVESVTHLFWRAEAPERVEITARLISHHGQAFVFCRTKRGADRVAQQLRSHGVSAAAIHGDRTQAQRARALASFSVGSTNALVATDVVARGIHVDAVPCVVHFDPPEDLSAYVHRSGRTGRSGNPGTVVSLVPESRRGETRTLQRALGVNADLAIPFSTETAKSERRPADNDPGTKSSGRGSTAKRAPFHPPRGGRPSSQRQRARRRTPR
jgi:superfamily II DNA/RNA helicase